jgi:hypothetical protein
VRNECRKCLREYLPNRHERKRTLHHVLPRRFFGHEGWCVELCRSCHDEIEKLIPYKEKMATQWYWNLVFHFFQETHVHVVDWSSRNEAIAYRSKYEMPSLQRMDIQRLRA